MDTTNVIIQLVNNYCSFEERAVVAKACQTVPERVSELYEAELLGTPMCCCVHAAQSFYRICKRALERPS